MIIIIVLVIVINNIIVIYVKVWAGVLICNAVSMFFNFVMKYEFLARSVGGFSKHIELCPVGVCALELFHLNLSTWRWLRPG
jgi:hypothetical protein